MAVLFESLRFINSAGITEPANYLYQDGVIRKTDDEAVKDVEVVDCSGFLGSQGWIDLKCFNGEPGLEHKESLQSLDETLSRSGFVSAVLLPNTEPSIQTKNDVEFLKNKTKEFFSNIEIQACVTRDAKGEDLTEILDLNHHGVRIFGDGLAPISNSDRLMKVLQYLQKFDGILFDHSYDPLLSLFGQMHEGLASTKLGMKGIPALAEEVAVQKNIEILKYAGGNLHFQTISTAGAVELIRKAKKDGLSVTADVSLYQLLFSDEDLVSFDTNMKVEPPLRGEADRKALMEGLRDGTIDAIVSNHRPQDFDAKHLEFDYASNGMIGLQTFLPGLVTLSKELDWSLLIDKVTKGPQHVLKLADQANSFTIFSPDEKWVYDRKSNTSLSSNSPFLNQELTGKVKYVINGSKFVKIDE